MPICNGLDRGSNFASIRKDVDLLMVFSCVNGNKLTKVRYSTIPIGERLTNNYVSGLLSRITKSVMHNNWCLIQKRLENTRALWKETFMYGSCDKKPNRGLWEITTLSIRSIPIPTCIAGNGFVWSLGDNVESTKPACDNLLGKEAMENRKVNHRLRDHNVKMRNQVVTHSQKVRDMA